MHSIWCLYLSVIGSISLLQFLTNMKFWDRDFRVGDSIVRGSNMLALQYMFVMETMFFFLIIMCAIMGVTLLIFVSYHFYLIAGNQTTNERVKSNDYLDELKNEKSDLKEFLRKCGGVIEEEVVFNGEKMSRKQFEEYFSDINHKLSVMERER